MARGTYQRLACERGDLGAFLAAAMLLPLLLLLALGGAETVHLLGLRSLATDEGYAALRTVEMAGGVTPAISQELSAQIDGWTGSSGATVGGTSPGQPWGSPVCLVVRAPVAVSWPGYATRIDIGGTYCGVSDLPPSGA